MAKRTGWTRFVGKLKPTKQRRNQLRLGGIVTILLLVGVLCGMVLSDRVINKPSTTRIWATDQSVVIPDDLYTFLQDQPACEQSVTKQPGVRLWAVMQVEQASFARLAYGCSTELTQYQMAVLIDGKWRLLAPNDYFADNKSTALPSCKVTADYKIPATIEPFCINTKGKAVTNEK